MNESLKAFLALNQAVTLIHSNDDQSLELKQSATDLSQSIQLCTDEMRQSAVKLEQLLKNCYQDLDQAEEVWNSKARILSIPKDEIWEQIAQISNIDVRIRNLRKKCQIEVLRELKESWTNQVTELKRQWFTEKNTGKPKQEAGLSDKDGLIKSLERELVDQNRQIILAIHHNLELIGQDFSVFNIHQLDSHFSCLPSKYKNSLLFQINSNHYRLNLFFNFKLAISNSLANLIKPSWDSFYKDSFLVIKRDRLDEFSNTVLLFMESSLLSQLDECFDLALSTLMLHLTFYDDLLEKQNRYEQEMPQKWQAEKQSLDQLRSQIDKVQTEIDTILNSISTS
ncbi:hypothetical protein L2E65_15080 [Planktothrix agardhii 1801]|jgi:hypothetical protein|uniref:hypothetical protein n=1 Tax=Planktothrix agardhii TaxID=1160 RepID=UPI001F35E095|nr:hypothetical protein [Planktothrix agardhii]MCF3626107.1 hypothetical protein [Planktothrix agardhii 1801]